MKWNIDFSYKLYMKWVERDKKAWFFYCAVLRTAQRAWHSVPGSPVHSGNDSTSLGNILSRQQLCANTIHSHEILFPRQSIARELIFIQLSELGHRGQTNMTNLRNGSKGDSNRVFSIASPAFYCRATVLHMIPAHCTDIALTPRALSARYVACE